MLDVLIIGGKKCGSTSLVDFLRSSDKVNYCIFKSSSFLTRKNLNQENLNEYKNYFPDIDGIKVEGSPANSDPKNVDLVISNLKLMKAKPKVILIARNPVKRIESNYMQDLKVGKLPKKGVTSDTYIYGPHKVLILGLFGYVINKYEKAFGSKSVLVLKFDKLIESNSEELLKVIKFLDLEDLDLSLPLKNKSDGAYSGNFVGKFYKKYLAYSYKRIGLPSLNKFSQAINFLFSRKIMRTERIVLSNGQVDFLKFYYSKDDDLFKSLCGWSYWDLQK